MESEKVKARAIFLQVDDLRFLSIDLKTHTAFNERFNETAEPLRLVARKDDKIVRIADESGFCPLRRSIRSMKYPVEIVKIKICK